MKGDRVEVVIDTGDGTQTFEITASRAGRRVDISVSRGVVEISEVTRGGTAVRTGRFMASRIIAMVEHPASENSSDDDQKGGRSTRTVGRAERRRGAPADPDVANEPLGL